MMSGTNLLVAIAGSAALLLWGIRMARTAVTRAHGSQVRRILPWTLRNRGYAFFTGLGAAALLQSSTAVAIFLASLASTGVVPVAGGLAVMLGADVGSAVVAVLLTLNVKDSWYALILVGYAIHSVYEGSNSKAKQHGRFILGIGVVLIALTSMSQMAHQLTRNNILKIIIGSLANEPILAAVVFAILTWVAHSSVSILLLLGSLVEAGIVSNPAFLAAAILGVNLGGGIPPVLLTWRQTLTARRIVVGNALFRLIGVCVAILFVEWFGGLFELLPGTTGFKVVLSHMLFNTALAIVFIGLVPYFVSFLERILPTPPPTGEEEEFSSRYIPPIPGAFEAALPISALARETLRMVDVIQLMLRQTLDVLRMKTNPGDRVTRIRRLDDKADALYKAIRSYAIDLSKGDLSEGELKRVNSLLRYALNLENSGDVIEKSLLDISAQKAKSHRSFSDDGDAELSRLFSYISGSLQMSAEVLMSWRADMALALSHRKGEFKAMVLESSNRHIDRLRQGVSSSLETSSYHLDIINDLQRINSLITAIAEDAINSHEAHLPAEYPLILDSAVK
ncbi:MAG: Na/Pi cotransporter family protein [Planctomycetes bacterium]|nr:Na/Pi cotransporter family protein [Planctomycetota bacterium]